MRSNVLCYINRERITDWKRLTITRKDSTWIFGSNNRKIFFEELKNGGTLWIVSPVPQRPPELVARIPVKTVKKREDLTVDEFRLHGKLLYHYKEWKFIAFGKKESEFFGYNDVGNALLETTFEAPSGKLWLINKDAKIWESKFGMKFQAPRKISTFSLNSRKTGNAALESLANTRTHSLFISWKWRDTSKKDIKALAYFLADNGFMPWLDLLALPKAKVFNKLKENEVALEKLLKYGYKRCYGVIGVDTIHYGIPSSIDGKNWTLWEWDGTLSHSKKIIRIAYQLKGKAECKILSNADIRLSHLKKFLQLKIIQFP